MITPFIKTFKHSREHSFCPFVFFSSSFFFFLFSRVLSSFLFFSKYKNINSPHNQQCFNNPLLMNLFLSTSFFFLLISKMNHTNQTSTRTYVYKHHKQHYYTNPL